MRKSPNQKVRDAAVSHLAAAERARQARATLAELRPGLATAAFALATAAKKDRTIHDAKRKPNLDGKIVRREGAPNTGDKEVDEAYRFSGQVHDFYRRVFDRNSIDDNGLRLKSSVRYREDPEEPYNNAFWFNNQMAYGDGDGIIFRRFTIALDVVGHELSHGVVEHTANLVYFADSGALNEHFADVFGSLVKQYAAKQNAAQADWLIGDKLIEQTATRRALRSMKAPGTAYQNDPDLGNDPQPDHISRKYTGFADRRGVHINSGIPNKAFFEVAASIGGNAWEKPGKIWYNALRLGLSSNSGFDDCANATFVSAGMLHGSGSSEQEAVRHGWSQVGINI